MHPASCSVYICLRRHEKLPLTSTNAPKYILYGGDLQRLLDDNCTVAQLNEKAASNFFEFLPAGQDVKETHGLQ
ncbi:hypothetical protein NC651_009033 [Populus alba x Populus x berolinensis]|nr:hypothetical protein NC651_009028 [Populus alba x Populus x berolinensis]KAJ6933818.1 hypothetical protein NC651_009033 [Populus alba x Populus x berolinensis]